MNGVLSMTSFGRGEHQVGERTWVAEIKSVNHRFCDIKIKLPRKYAGLEERIRKLVGKAYSRGHIEVTLTPAGGRSGTIRLKADLEMARQYLNCLKQIQTELLPESPPTIDLLTRYPDIIVPEEQEEDLDAIWNEMIHPALESALANAHSMRLTEGSHLRHDLRNRLQIITHSADSIETMIPELAEAKKTALKERLEILLGDVKLDEIRLAQEVAMLVDRLDVTEELVRLRSHLRQFDLFLDQVEPNGRKLDFLLQEFLREVNTLASKISNAEVAHLTVEAKNEIEKMREQVQNIE
ncbi:MAG: YicC family protein [Proteobacteria bacterium]|nr:YicC family protein [Pseudomonadota bacterium]MBU1686757.1 YicC family protein [Pseudomonadota bacterium]